MEIIPAIDIINGKCVRLSQGNYSNCKIYSENPLEIARQFEKAGIKRLHVVDLDGAKSTGVVNISTLRDICQNTSLKVDFGGGVKSEEDVEKVFQAGASFICVGSMAQTNPQKTKEWLDKYGKDKIIVGADVWNGKVCINGWKKVTDTHIFDMLADYGDSLKYVVCTDISKDGMLSGPSFELYTELQEKFPDIYLIASGGVSKKEDLDKLQELGIPATIVGKAIYENRIKVEDLKAFSN